MYFRAVALGARAGEECALTERQLQVVRLAALGLSNEQIADRLGIQPRTVKQHVNRAVELLGAQGRLDLILIALLRGLADREMLNMLAEQQVSIARLVACGLSNLEIGRRLNLSESTIKRQLSAIFRKTNTEDRIALALWVIRCGLVSLAMVEREIGPRARCVAEANRSLKLV